MKKSIYLKLFFGIVILFLFTCCRQMPKDKGFSTPTKTEEQTDPKNTLDSKNEKKESAPKHKEKDEEIFSLERVAKYVQDHGELPPEYIKKEEARNLGWKDNEGNLWKVAPGRAIGGDRFGNREEKLPTKKNRIYYEADLNYEGGYRGAERLIFSNDGLIYYTLDHYETFILWEGEE